VDVEEGANNTTELIKRRGREKNGCYPPRKGKRAAGSTTYLCPIKYRGGIKGGGGLRVRKGGERNKRLALSERV